MTVKSHPTFLCSVEPLKRTSGLIRSGPSGIYRLLIKSPLLKWV